MTGIKNRVKNVELISPPITVRAIGDRMFDPSEVVTAIGSMPIIVVPAVIRTGRIRVRPASTRAALIAIPFFRS